MSQFEFSFNELNDADLIVDAVYKGGDQKDIGADPLSKLLGCGNQRGFRYLGNSPNYKMVVLYSTLKNTDWPDFIDMESGIFTYYGDNKTSGHILSEPRGNKLLEFVFNILHNSQVDRHNIPPFFVFTKGNSGRDVVFRGIAAPGAQGIPSTEDLVAIWRSTDGQRFQNYKAIFTILDIAVVSRVWITELQRGEILGLNCPDIWRRWVEKGVYTPLKSQRTVGFRSEKEQLPSNERNAQIVNIIYEYFKDDPYSFEACAAEIVCLMDKQFKISEITRRSADGGRDAIGTYNLGVGENTIKIDFSLEAKCYALKSGVLVRHTSRLISRLRHRNFGVLVTTSYVAQQAYKELVEDNHPVLIIAAEDIAKIVSNAGFGTREAVTEWLNTKFPK